MGAAKTPWRDEAADAAMQPVNSTATVLMMVVLVAALFFGRAILVPLALAILISFALAPLVVMLRRTGLGRVPSVLTVVVLATLALGALSVLVASQVVSLANNLPLYQYNLQSKIRELRDAVPSGGVFDRASSAIRDLNREIEEAAQGEEDTVARASQEGDIDVIEPVPVEVHERPPTAFETLRNVLGPLIEPVVTGGLVLVFVIFMLIERTELRDRLIRLIDEKDLARATRAIDDAARRVSRYLLMQLMINLAHGVPYGLGLWLIGVPNPFLWGLLATILRFVPYLGPVLTAVFPLLVALAVDPGWTMVLQVAALIIVLELFTNNVLEPWLYGATTGLSPVAILVAAVFWTTLWGPVGLLLSVPLTVCFVVLGRHVPQLRFLDVMLGDRPALTTPARVYQRLLAGDRHEASELAEDYEEEHGFARTADELLLPALVHAERDRVRRALDAATEERIGQNIETISAFLAEPELPQNRNDAEQRGEEHAVAPERPLILCIGGRSGLDLASAGLLALTLEIDGFDTTVLPHAAVRASELQRLEGQPRIACIAYLSPPARHHERRLVRRLKAWFGEDLAVVACQWLSEARAGESEADALVRTIGETAAELRHRLGLPAASGPDQPAVPEVPPFNPAPAGAP
jgi:predicted PurR-regulated permease PerM